MYASRIRAAGLAVAASIAVSACATYPGLGYNGVSVGIGSGYDPYYGYGYQSSRYGYGYGYPSSRYGYGYGYPSYGYYPRYGSIYGQPWGGFYDGYYYPGTGYYVYRDGRRQRWSSEQRRYFENLRQRWHDRAVSERSGDSSEIRANRRLFEQRVDTARRDLRQDRREIRRAVRSGDTDRATARQQRSAERREFRQERRQARRELRRENRRERID